MKHNTPHIPSIEPHLMPVRFEFTDPKATAVFVAGTFNQWTPEAKALHAAGGGRWFKDTALPPGTYEYRLIVDGHWMADPLAKESVANPFGGRNSVLKVGGPIATATAIIPENKTVKSKQK